MSERLPPEDSLGKRVLRPRRKSSYAEYFPHRPRVSTEEREEPISDTENSGPSDTVSTEKEETVKSSGESEQNLVHLQTILEEEGSSVEKPSTSSEIAYRQTPAIPVVSIIGRVRKSIRFIGNIGRTSGRISCFVENFG